MKPLLKCAGIVLAVAIHATDLQAAVCTATPAPSPTLDLFGLTPVGSGGMLAVGEDDVGGGIYVGSSDLTSWSKLTACSPVSGAGRMHAAAASSTTWMAVGSGDVIAASSNAGGTWTTYSTGIGADWRDVAVNPSNRWVAVSVQHAVGYSDSNGSNWTGATLSGITTETFALLGVTWAGSQFVAVGDPISGYSGIFASADGMTWTKQTVTPTDSSVTAALLNQRLNAVAATANGTTVVAVGNNSVVVRSGNGGLSWVALGPANASWTYSLEDIARSDSLNLFVAVGISGGILTSPDGVTWTRRASNVSTSLYEVAWTGTEFVVAGAFGTLLTSSNGIDWTVRQVSAPEAPRTGGGSFAALELLVAATLLFGRARRNPPL